MRLSQFTPTTSGTGCSHSFPHTPIFSGKFRNFITKQPATGAELAASHFL
uniref:Uncharacterized protein n=1 Tax=Rhizophora mucronata TaxID=61149 RepID=A0A2P2R428_RHIMU